MFPHKSSQNSFKLLLQFASDYMFFFLNLLGNQEFIGGVISRSVLLQATYFLFEEVKISL